MPDPNWNIPESWTPLGWTKKEFEEYLRNTWQYEEEITSTRSNLSKVGAVLKSIGTATVILSFFLQQVTFTYFIYEETCQLTEGIIKQLTRCGHKDEAKRILLWYYYDLFPDYVVYHYNTKILAPISWQAFEKHIENVQKFLERYRQLLGVW